MYRMTHQPLTGIFHAVFQLIGEQIKYQQKLLVKVEIMEDMIQILHQFAMIFHPNMVLLKEVL
jgi:hypothetical protein